MKHLALIAALFAHVTAPAAQAQAIPAWPTVPGGAFEAESQPDAGQKETPPA